MFDIKGCRAIVKKAQKIRAKKRRPIKRIIKNIMFKWFKKRIKMHKKKVKISKNKIKM